MIGAMSKTASLPMYNFRGMRCENSAFWAALSGLLRAAGIPDVPRDLTFDQAPVPDRIESDMLFTQTCGYPLQTLYRGQYQILATPCYRSPGCDGATHSAYIVVRADDGAESLEDLRGTRFALNSRYSNSGMNLPRRLIAPLSIHGRFFGEVVHSGSQSESLNLVRSGAADTASVDCLTWEFASAHAPSLVEQLRVLAQTQSSPSIPFVTAAATPLEHVRILRNALLEVGNEPSYEDIRAGLRISGIVVLPDDAYETVSRFEREAALLGYPVIA
jgi:ABC-type phosphate/phosphonate transport system substrate-binding protein